MSLYEISHVRNSMQEARLAELQQKIQAGLKDLAITIKSKDHKKYPATDCTLSSGKYRRWMPSECTVATESRPYSPYYESHKSINRSSLTDDTESLTNQRTPSLISSATCATASTSEMDEHPLKNKRSSYDTNKRDRYGFKKYNQWISAEHSDAFEKSYRTILDKQSERWKRLLSNSNHQEWPVLCPQFMKYVRKGIPKDLRVKMWMHYSGAEKKMRAHPEKYTLLLRIADKLGSINDYAEIIERDLHRTFPDNIYFNTDPDTEPTVDTHKITQLRNVLLAFSIDSPQIGYCQSLNFLAGFILLLDDINEEQAFWLLTTLVHDYFPKHMFDTGMEGVGIEQTVLMMLIYETMPGLWSKIAEKRCFWECEQSDSLPSVTLVTSHWFLTLFINILPVEAVFRIWDCLLVGEGFKIIYQVALTILKLNEDNIRNVDDYVDIFQVLQKMPKKLVDCHQFMEVVFSSQGIAFDLTYKEINQKRSLFLNRRAQRRKQ